MCIYICIYVCVCVRVDSDSPISPRKDEFPSHKGCNFTGDVAGWCYIFVAPNWRTSVSHFAGF